MIFSRFLTTITLSDSSLLRFNASTATMTKKDYILKMLDMIKDIFPPAQDLRALVEGGVVNDQMIDTLTAMIKEIKKVISDEAQKLRLDKSIEFMDKLKAVEAAEHIKDEQKLQELEAIFKSI